MCAPGVHAIARMDTLVTAARPLALPIAIQLRNVLKSIVVQMDNVIPLLEHVIAT